MRNSILALLLSASASVFAQTAVVSIPAQQCVWHAGDDPAWAAANLDQSGWQPYAQWKANPNEPRYWVRCQTDLSALSALRNPAIQVDLYAAYELFVNGEQVGGAGSLRSGHFSMEMVRSFPLRKPLPPNAVVAFRLTYWPFISEPMAPLQAHLGDASALRDRRAGIVLKQISGPLKAVIYYGVIAVLGFVLLGLYLNDLSRSELLILSFECFGVATIYLNLAGLWALVDYSSVAFETIFGLAMVASGLAYPWFFFRLVGRRVPLLFWAIIFLAVQDHALWLPAAYLPFAQDHQLFRFYDLWAAPVGFAARVLVASAPFVAFWPYSRLARRTRPLAVLCMVWGAEQMFYFFVHLSELKIIPGLPNLYPRWNPTLIEISPVTSFCVIAALMWLLFRDQRHVADERAELSGQMQAARRVQQYLIPARLPETPGVAIESAYHPAREVGGDFFQILPHPSDGSVMIVVGDVAGKGIEAGMLAALIVGAIRTAAEFTTEPGRILSLLNKRLQGRGLVTCLALRIEPDGSVTLANAGHLPPYLNGSELEGEGALPLGLVPYSDFPISRWALAEGDALTLITDGVVEAQDAEGRLFGFERIDELMGNGVSGAALAEAAQSFGQQDDITVLTIRLTSIMRRHEFQDAYSPAAEATSS